MATFKIHPEALKEIEDSASFYEIRQQGLGKRFLRALNEAIRKIESHPLLYKEIDDRVRKCRLLSESEADKKDGRPPGREQARRSYPKKK